MAARSKVWETMGGRGIPRRIWLPAAAWEWLVREAEAKNQRVSEVVARLVKAEALSTSQYQLDMWPDNWGIKAQLSERPNSEHPGGRSDINGT